MIINDVYEKKLAVGVTVAFNYSGELRIGNIVEIKPAKRYGKTVNDWTREAYVTIHIQHCDSRMVSKITNRKNVVVI